MSERSFRSICLSIALVCAAATPLAAQSTRDEWLVLRTQKQARHHRITPSTQPGVLTIVTIRFYPDGGGNLVGVGEARNDSSFNLSYSRINFRFFAGNGADLGGEWTYLFGGSNARILSNNAYESVLPPGRTGFFKVWTSVPASSMSSYTAAAAGEDIPFTKPQATFGAEGRPEGWSSLVNIFWLVSLVGQRVSGNVLNDDWISPYCPCGHPSILTYSVRVSVAAYQDGVITDVQSTLAVGPRAAGTQCGGEPTTGMMLHESSGFTIDLARPANSIGNQSVEWEEMAVSPAHLLFSDVGGSGTFAVERQCGWNAVTADPWIFITDGAASDQDAGRVTFTVQRNTGTQTRFGLINVSGGLVAVTQGRACEVPVSPATVFLGAGFVTDANALSAPADCLIGVASDAPWLPVVGRFDNTLRVSAQPNLTGATRRAVVKIGDQSITVYQSAGSRNADFNADGRLDLLWHHRTDGRVATWRMNGAQMSDGTLLTPGQVADTNWTPVAAGDLDRNGTTDILWQNAADGRLSFWRMVGTVMREGAPISPSQVADTDWKIRAMSDFNQDGDPDLVWQHDGTGHIAVWFMRAGRDWPYGLSTSPTQMSGEALGPGQVTDLNWKIVGSGDFNRDGWPDLVWQHQGDGRIAVWKMHGTTLVDGELISPGHIADLDWKIRGVGDINGDDMPDLFWQHRSSGEVGAWLMNGTTMMSGISLGRVPDTDWLIVGPR